MIDPPYPIFKTQTAQAFMALVTNSSYKIKSRPTQENCNRMLEFAFNPSLPYLPHEKHLANRSRTKFHTYQGRIYANPSQKCRQPRAVILHKDVVDIVARIHRQELHAGADTVFCHAIKHFSCVTKEVRWLLPFCLLCPDERAATSAPAPLQLIASAHPYKFV
jgi:hypothetical protein